MTDPIDALVASLAEHGYVFAPAATMREVLHARHLGSWPDFAASWDDLGLDTYMADGGRYRRRRHATLRVTAQAITRMAHQPHYQSRDYNQLNGGIARWFDPVLDRVADSAAMHAILAACRDLFGRLSPDVAAWHVELHQFRIEAQPGQSGLPTPEGLHRDGVDWVLVLLIGRRNIASGVTSIHDSAGAALGSFTLTEPMDAALVDDHRVFHGVTPVQAQDPARPAHRDVLVVTFRRAPVPA